MLVRTIFKPFSTKFRRYEISSRQKFVATKIVRDEISLKWLGDVTKSAEKGRFLANRGFLRTDLLWEKGRQRVNSGRI